MGDGVPETPDPSEAWPAVLSWVKPKIISFELAPPPVPVPEVVLASTAAVEGPAHFVVRKAYQTGTTVACDPPRVLYVAERRDLFRLPVATRVRIQSGQGKWSTYTMDCSLGGLRVAVPGSLEIGTEVRLDLELGTGETAVVEAAVRHCHPLGEHAIVGLQFLEVGPRTEHRLAAFVNHKQQRLLPRVHATVPVDYGPEGGRPRREAMASELSPGDVIFVAGEAHAPGERLGLQLRVSRHEFAFVATVVSSGPVPAGDGSRYQVVRASLDDVSAEVQAQFRRAVRELALERVQ